MSYPRVTKKEGTRFLRKRKAGEDPGPLQIDEATPGDTFSWSELALKVKAEIEKVRLELGAIEKGTGKGALFEARTTEIIHKGLPRPHPALFDPEFFIWLTMSHFFELVEWRFGKDANDANYGLGNPREGLLFRLWLRAEIAYSPLEKD